MPAGRNYRRYNNKSQVLTVFLVSLFLMLGLVAPVAFSPVVFAGDDCDEIEDLDDQLECYEKEEEEARGKLDDALAEQEKIAGLIDQYLNDLFVTQDQLNQLAAAINSVISELGVINENLAKTEASLRDKILLRNDVLRAYYQQGRLTLLELFLTQSEDLNGFSLASLVYAYDKSVTEEALDLIKKLQGDISAYEKAKAEAEQLQEDLEYDQAQLLVLQADLDNKKAQAEEEKTEIDEEVTSLEEKIAALSEKQRSILAAKAGSGIVSGYVAASYKLPDPPFKPAFAAMSYGAYTHRNGMSQYGAKGRAEDGDDYKEILEYYYDTDVEKKDDFPDDLKVDGYGEMDFQEYLYGLAEMPGSWPMDALKAQAIAGRTYAYGFEKAGKSICTTQSCQVYSESKANLVKNKSTEDAKRWKEAVDDTKDKILDDPANTQYSSTTGGYLNQSGWDDDGDWPGDAYEKKAGSPWFYKAWYTESYTDNSSTCGRDTPWLEEEEMIDILNAWVVWRHDPSNDHITPVTTSCWGGDPYSHDKMADKAADKGEEYTDISDVWVDISNGGYTATVHFKTNRGTVSINGTDFATIFNLRAPHYVSIRGVQSNSTALFDIEYEN